MFKRIALFVFVSISTIFAQEQLKELPKYRQGVDFYLINGYGIAYKFGGCTNAGYRIEADFSLSFSDGKTENKTESISSSYSVDENNNYDSFSYYIRIFPQMYFSLYSGGRVSINYGFGPLLKYSHSKIVSDVERTAIYSGSASSNSYTVTRKDNDYYLGAGLFVNVEGKITENISIYAESQLGGGKAWEYSDYSEDSVSGDSHYTTKTDTYRWFLSLENIRFGVSLYF